jgi:hypothetical protein
LVFSSFPTTVVGLGKPTVRFGISFETQKTVFTSITNGMAPGSNRAVPHRTMQSKDLNRRSRQEDPTCPAITGGLLGISNESATHWRDKARASPLRSRAACTRNGFVGRTDLPPMHTCMTRRNGKGDAKGYRRANNHAKVEVSKTLATFLHRRATATHSTEEAAKLQLRRAR